MEIVSALILGIIQGLCEFLPVSSSGHLALLSRMGLSLSYSENDVGFFAFLHLGTLAAVLWVYRKDFFPLIPAFFSLLREGIRHPSSLWHTEGRQRLVWCLFLGTLPLAGAVLLEEQVNAVTQSIRLVGCFLLLNGLQMLLCDRFCHGRDDLSRLRISQALTVGCFQLLALFPGLSRSGTTVTGGRLAGLDLQSALTFSFLLSVPAVLGANLWTLPDWAPSLCMGEQWLPYAVGFFSSLFSGLLAVSFLRRLAKRGNFRLFSFYCFAAGLTAVILG